MRFGKPPQIPMRPVFAVFPCVRVRTQRGVFLRIFPRLTRQVGDRAVKRREDGGILAHGVEAAGNGIDVSTERGEDVDLPGRAHDIAEYNVVVGVLVAAVIVAARWRKLDARCTVHYWALAVVVNSSLLVGFGVGEEGDQLRMRGEKEAGREKGRC